MQINLLKTNPEAETEGVWVTYEDTDIQLKIARIGNPKFDAFVAKKSAPHLDKIRKGEANELQENITQQAVAHTILVDWKNIDDENGKPIPYSGKKSEEFLSDPSLRDFYKFVLVTSNQAENFRYEAQQEAVGN
tara:strand:+ start:12824 stop:13225 length:402 start_codon:yes stop_codon:yes gene_type:complete